MKALMLGAVATMPPHPRYERQPGYGDNNKRGPHGHLAATQTTDHHRRGPEHRFRRSPRCDCKVPAKRFAPPAARGARHQASGDGGESCACSCPGRPQLQSSEAPKMKTAGASAPAVFGCDCRCVQASALRRRRITAPIRPSPAANITMLVGSGTTVPPVDRTSNFRLSNPIPAPSSFQIEMPKIS